MGKQIKKTKPPQEKVSENINSSSHINEELLPRNNDLSRKPLEFQQDYFLHGCPEKQKQFPIHHYIANKRIAQFLKYCLLYFDPTLKSQASQEVVIPLHLTHLLNSMINLCYRLPAKAVAFMLIREFNCSQVLMKVCNMRREIICYEIFKKNACVNEKMIEFKKSFKLKGSPFLFIVDMCPENGNNKYDRKFFKNLQNCFRYIYCKNNLSQQQLQDFLNSQQPSEKTKIAFQIQENQLWVYSNSSKNHPSIDQFIQSKTELYRLILSFEEEHEDFFKKNSNLQTFGRLYTYDIMMYNYTRAYDKSIEQFLKYITRMQSIIAPANQSQISEVDADNNHYPGRILHSKRCKNCEIMGVTTNKKSKYKCISCTEKFNSDVPLCVVGCFAEFHELVLPVVGDCKLKGMKNVYEKKLMEKEEEKRIAYEKELEEKRADPYRIVKDAEEADKFNDLFKTYNKMNELLKALGEVDGTEQIQKTFVSYMYIRNLQASELLKKKKAEIEEYRNRQQLEKIKKEHCKGLNRVIKREHEIEQQFHDEDANQRE